MRMRMIYQDIVSFTSMVVFKDEKFQFFEG